MPSALKDKLKSTLKSLDFLAPDIGLNYEGRSGVKTYVGAVFSLLALVAFLVASAFIVKEAVRRDKPSVLLEYSSSKVYPPFDLVANKKLPIFLFVNATEPVLPSEVPKYVHVKAVSAVETATTTADFNYQETPIEMVPCSQLGWDKVLEYSPKEASEYERFVIDAFGLCPKVVPTADFSVHGRASDPERRLFTLSIFPCVPELLAPGETCAPKASLQGSKMFVTRAVLNVDLTNHENPISYSWDTESDFGLLLDRRIDVITKLKSVEIWNSYGSFIQDTQVVSICNTDDLRELEVSRDPNKIQCTLSEVSSNSCPAYRVFQTNSGGIKEIYTRNYSGILQVLGDIGGIREVVFSSFLLMYLWFHTKSEQKMLVESIFGPLNLTATSQSSFPHIKQNQADEIHAASDLIEENLSIENLLVNCFLMEIWREFILQKSTSSNLNGFSNLELANCYRNFKSRRPTSNKDTNSIRVVKKTRISNAAEISNLHDEEFISGDSNQIRTPGSDLRVSFAAFLKNFMQPSDPEVPDVRIQDHIEPRKSQPPHLRLSDHSQKPVPPLSAAPVFPDHKNPCQIPDHTHHNPPDPLDAAEILPVPPQTELAPDWMVSRLSHPL